MFVRSFVRSHSHSFVGCVLHLNMKSIHALHTSSSSSLVRDDDTRARDDSGRIRDDASCVRLSFISTKRNDDDDDVRRSVVDKQTIK